MADGMTARHRLQRATARLLHRLRLSATTTLELVSIVGLFSEAKALPTVGAGKDNRWFRL